MLLFPQAYRYAHHPAPAASDRATLTPASRPVADTHTHAPQYVNLSYGDHYELLDWLK